MLRGVLFDLGSTLQEYYNEDWVAIDRDLNGELYHYLASRGHATRLPPLDEFIEVMHVATRAHWDNARTSMRGSPLLTVLQPMFDRHGISDVTPEECLLPWYRGVTEITYVRPDVKPTLELLRDRGLKLGLVSNTSWSAGAHDPDLDRFGLKDLLPCRIYSCEVGWEKPAPQIFHAALECTGLAPEETVFVGDFLRYDVAGAQAVGMKAVWKKVADRPDDWDDHSIEPDAVITSMGELPAVLDTLYN
jgi:putative hydrolase of the HAD superfamily